MKSCLIISAQADTRSTVREFLAHRRYDVLQVANADEALAICRRDMPDIVVLDDSAEAAGKGYAFLRKLRRTRRGGRAIVLYCSSDSDPAAMGTAIVDGASECLIKPFDEDLLEFKLQQAGLDTRM